MPNDELAMFRLAQEITDEVMGKGTYARVNHFDPKKGETRQTVKPAAKAKPRKRGKHAK